MNIKPELYNSEQTFAVPLIFLKYICYTLEVYTFHAPLLVLHLRMTAHFLL